MSNHYVYILRCKDDTYYTGYTTDYNRRLAEHNSGKGAKYTRGRGPCTIVYLRKFRNKSVAMKEEYRIKQLSRDEKTILIKRDSTIYPELY